MKKRMIVVLLLLMSFMVFGSLDRGQKIQAQTNDERILTSTSTHLLTNVDEAIDTSVIRVRGAFGEIFLNQATLTSANSAVTITANAITVSEKGIFPISFQYPGTTMTLHVISKLATETEYVIYEENFSYPNGAIPSSLTLLNNVGQPGGSAAIDGNRLLLSPSTIVLFPSYLQGFSNYIIETDMRMSSAANSSRWTSVMFRYQTENYYQMAVRQDATLPNGVEFAKRVEGSWNVTGTGSYTEALAPGTTYRLKVDVNGTTVKEFINDTEIINYDAAFEFTHGRIGVQADNVNVYYDNVKITLPEDYIEVDQYQFQQVVDVYKPTTGIVAPATTLVWFNELSQLDDFSAAIRPATAIFRINEDLDVVDASGNVLLPLYDALLAVDGKVIPAFYTNNATTAASLGSTLRNYRIFDTFIVSDDGDVILAAREAHSLMRGVLNFPMTDVESLSKEDLIEVRKATNTAQAVASIIPVHLLNQDLVHYMQQRVMTVWTTADNDDVSQYKAILSGANGIITQDFESLFEKYASLGPNTHVRRPLMIAHRGLYAGGLSSAPENTIEASQEALSKGADIIEFDVYLTLDQEVIVIHDATTARTAPGYDSLTISQSTLEQVKSVNLVDPIGGRENLKIPTLREFMTAFKDEDVVLFIEIKPTSDLLVLRVAEIIEDLDMYDQSAIITFSTANIQSMNVHMPELSNGHLTGAVLNAQNLNTSLTNLFSTNVPINSTLNPSYGALTRNFVEAIVHRGITVWPWTLNEYNVIVQYYNYGVGGITTDHLGYIQDTFNRVVFDTYNHLTLLEDATDIRIRAAIETPAGLSYPYMPEMTIIDDGGTGIVIDLNGNVTQVNSTGTAHAFTKFNSTMPNGISFTITGDLVTIDIVSEIPQEPGDEPDTNNTAIIVVSIIGGSAALGVGGFFGIRYLLKLRKIS
jgi:glycerophosphoryl diester phosphodiesterase